MNISAINEQLLDSPYYLYQTDKLKLIRIKENCPQGVRTLRTNGTEGKMYTNKDALKKIMEIIEENEQKEG